MTKAPSCIPYFAVGEVVKGFGRGSRELGIPTANFSEKVVNAIPDNLSCGVYYGWANVDQGPVYKMVLCVGQNPYYKNEKKSMETHILNTFEEDFYGSILRVVIVGYIRPMKNYKSVDDLISAIKMDVAEADEKLDLADYQHYKENNFFSSLNGL